MKKLVEMYKVDNIEIEPFGKLDKNLFNLVLKPKEEYVIASLGADTTLVLDTTLDEDLMLEGAYRELVRTAQVLRKEADFNIEDRIEMDIVSTSDYIRKVEEKYADKIKQEVLVTVLDGNIPAPDFVKEVEVVGEKVILKLKVAKGESK